jgi:hypothetical protein
MRNWITNFIWMVDTYELYFIYGDNMTYKSLKNRSNYRWDLSLSIHLDSYFMAK